MSIGCGSFELIFFAFNQKIKFHRSIHFDVRVRQRIKGIKSRKANEWKKKTRHNFQIESIRWHYRHAHIFQLGNAECPFNFFFRVFQILKHYIGRERNLHKNLINANRIASRRRHETIFCARKKSKLFTLWNGFASSDFGIFIFRFCHLAINYSDIHGQRLEGKEKTKSLVNCSENQMKCIVSWHGCISAVEVECKITVN